MGAVAKSLFARVLTWRVLLGRLHNRAYSGNLLEVYNNFLIKNFKAMDFGQLVAQRKDDIIQLWMGQVRDASLIRSSHDVSRAGIVNSLPELLDAIAHILSHADTEDLHAAFQVSRIHGKLRAQQGFDAAEVVREYAILRDVLFRVMEPSLLASESILLLRTVRLVDGVIDRVMSLSLKLYTEERLRELNLLYDEMLASNRELDRLARNEQENLAHLAHELKSPLSCIIGYSDLFLRQHSDGSGLKLGFIERVLFSGRQLLEIVNETLEISSYQAGKVVLDIEPIDVCRLVEEVAKAMDPLAHQKGLAVMIDCPVSDEAVMTDRKRLRQIVTNLVSNAVKYTEQGSVGVSVRQLEARVEIEIADTGPGIEPTEQARIFEPFYQGKAGQTLPSSTGLGLAIARQMVKLLQGNIYLASKVGVGSTFTISLPLNYVPESNNSDPVSESSTEITTDTFHSNDLP